jgi:hypothetical protein
MLQLTFELAGFNFSVPETKGPGSFPGCSQIAVKALNLQKPCGKPQVSRAAQQGGGHRLRLHQRSQHGKER